MELLLYLSITRVNLLEQCLLLSNDCLASAYMHHYLQLAKYLIHVDEQKQEAGLNLQVLQFSVKEMQPSLNCFFCKR